MCRIATQNPQDNKTCESCGVTRNKADMVKFKRFWFCTEEEATEYYYESVPFPDVCFG